MGCPAGPAPHSGRVLRRVISGLVILAALAPGPRMDGAGTPAAAAAAFAGRPARALVDPTKTSIYLGSVRLTLSPLQYRDGAFAADYAARVVPFFFFNEKGRLTIAFPDEQIRQLLRGETVYFQGQARNSAGRQRRIEGRAVPEGPGAAGGRIKVRVHVGKVELIFNSTYRLEAAG